MYRLIKRINILKQKFIKFFEIKKELFYNKMHAFQMYCMLAAEIYAVFHAQNFNSWCRYYKPRISFNRDDV